MEFIMTAIKSCMNTSAARSTEAGDSSRAPADPEAFAAEVAAKLKADVRMFSGCQDAQTSADVRDVSKFGLPDAQGAGGACTNALLMTLVDSQADTWLSVLKGMRQILSTKKFSQIPQLSTSRAIDVNSPFSILNDQNNGTSKALLIGINYVGQQGELAGCHNDVTAMQKYITEHGYPAPEGESLQILMDDGSHDAPTYENIINGFRWLIANAKAGDSLFMHYSGHGGSMADDNGDEADNKDETIVPVDYTSAGQIRDDEVLKELVASLPEGVTLTVVMDCCHSGSILDLPYMIKADDGTIQAVEAGSMSSVLEPNLNFDLEKLIRIAKEVMAMFAGGRGIDANAVGKLAAEIIS